MMQIYVYSYPAAGAQMFNPQAPGGPYAQYPYQQAYVAATAAGVQVCYLFILHSYRFVTVLT